MEVSHQSSAEVREVLNKYLQLFQQNSFDFKYFMAPNSVIDWYGRTIRGANKIHDYLRHEIYHNFDHSEFLEPYECGPIETKTSHMRTKIISTKPIDLIHPINRVPDMIPLKSYADSDVDDNELVETTYAAAIANNESKTPEKCFGKHAIHELTPPASATKNEKDEADEGEDEVDDAEHADEFTDNAKPQRALKRTHSERFSYLKRLPTAPSTSKRVSKDYKGVRTLLYDSSSEEDELETMEALYSSLQYIEVKGIMCNRNTAKYRQRSAIWRDCTQLETCLRISYRRKLTDNQLQFALIIYEPCNATPVTTKRNLMIHFSLGDVAPTTDSNQESEQPEEMVIENVLHEPVLIEPHAVTTTANLLGSIDDPFNVDDAYLETTVAAQMRTPTKLTNTPPATPKRKPRSLFENVSGLKRLNSSPTAPTPKRSAARSLRL